MARGGNGACQPGGGARNNARSGFADPRNLLVALMDGSEGGNFRIARDAGDAGLRESSASTGRGRELPARRMGVAGGMLTAAAVRALR